jgi:hypothetical protein
MAFKVSAFSVPKRGAIASDNQDAIWPRILGEPYRGQREISPKKGNLFAGVADGATEGVLAGEWANLTLAALGTVRNPVRSPSDAVMSLRSATRAWVSFKRLRTLKGTKPLTQLPSWLDDEAVARGAFATICAGWIGDDGSWFAVTLGDSCVFQLRQNELITSWPLTKSDEFNNSPYLFSSEPCRNAELESHIKTYEGHWQTQDHIYFATDALACWIMKQQEKDEAPWSTLVSLDPVADPEEFSRLVDSARDRGEMRNDDTTLLRVNFIPELQ